MGFGWEGFMIWQKAADWLPAVGQEPSPPWGGMGWGGVGSASRKAPTMTPILKDKGGDGWITEARPNRPYVPRSRSRAERSKIFFPTMWVFTANKKGVPAPSVVVSLTLPPRYHIFVIIFLLLLLLPDELLLIMMYVINDKISYNYESLVMRV